MLDDTTARPRWILSWLFFLVLPASVVASTLSIYVHEFAHGLTALALGGHFLGIKGQLFERHSRAIAFADAWSDHGHSLVLAAGIVVNVTIGAFLLRKAFRTGLVMPRLLLFSAASAFLADIAYAFEGCRLWRFGDFDTAFILQDLDSELLRNLSLVVLFPLMAAASLLVGRGLFRAWEDLLGPLGPWRAFLVILLLVSPVHWPNLRNPEGPTGLLIALTLFVGIAVYLIRTRRRDVAPVAAGRPWRWIGASWLVTLPAIAAIILLERGINLGTYSDFEIHEVRGEEKLAVGLRARYGMGDRYGNDRFVFDPELFLSSPDGIRFVPSPEGTITGATWLPSRQAFLVAGRRNLYEVSIHTGTSRQLWSAEKWDDVRVMAYGPQGQVLLSMIRPIWAATPLRPMLYAYDAESGRGRTFESVEASGTPYFLPGLPPRARVSLGSEVWQFTWDVDDEDGVRVDVVVEDVEEGWYIGSSGDHHWWSDGDGWWTSVTRITNRGATMWGVGNSGLYTLNPNGQWLLYSPSGDVSSEGRLDYASLKFFQIYEGLPWIAFRNGEVRRLDAQATEVRVLLPTSD